MQVKTLDHVNLRTAQLDTMIAWYRDVLGLHPGPRPDFSFAGAWLYIGDLAAVHLVEIDQVPPSGALKLEHFALGATGYATFLDILKSKEIECDLQRVPGFPIMQVNIHDPDGNHIHVDFDISEVPD